MITHTATLLPNGEVFLKTIWSGEDESVIIHSSCLTQEQAKKLSDQLLVAINPPGLPAPIQEMCHA